MRYGEGGSLLEVNIGYVTVTQTSKANLPSALAYLIYVHDSVEEKLFSNKQIRLDETDCMVEVPKTLSEEGQRVIVDVCPHG